jgi:hypothetical protein
MPTEAWIRTYPPKVGVGKGNSEAFKYGKLWALPQYRTVSPGEELAPFFLGIAKPKVGSEIIDFGCGTGRASMVFAKHGLNVTMVDFVSNCLDPNVKEKLGDKFCKLDLENKLPIAAEYGYCVDTMEHIPPDKTDTVLNNILLAAKHVFFAIPKGPDQLGELIGEQLHLTQHDFAWWKQKFVDRDCKIDYEGELPSTSIFYVSAWQDGQAIIDAGELNEAVEKIRENVKINCANGWEQVKPFETNDAEVMILGGGPSLNNYIDEIKLNRALGMKVVTLNGAYNWALQHEITPSATVCVDAREFNARFTHPVVDACKYLIASQCHPSTLEGLPKDKTFLWHTGSDKIEDILKETYGGWWPVPGGSTVLLRALPLLRMLGYNKFILYGCDSCVIRDNEDTDLVQSHAYYQPENDNDHLLPVVVGGKTFWCTTWMSAQATEFISLCDFLGEQIENLEVRGDGLLAWIINYGASLECRGDS